MARTREELENMCDEFNRSLGDLVSDQYDYISLLDRNDLIPRNLTIYRIGNLSTTYTKLRSMINNIVADNVNHYDMNGTILDFIEQQSKLVGIETKTTRVGDKSNDIREACLEYINKLHDYHEFSAKETVTEIDGINDCLKYLTDTIRGLALERDVYQNTIDRIAEFLGGGDLVKEEEDEDDE